MKLNARIVLLSVTAFLVFGMSFFLIQQLVKPVPTTGDWQTHLSVLSNAEIIGDRITVRHVRNFRYDGAENEASMRPAYEDRTYLLSQLKRVWYIAEPFQETSLAAHTFLSFEFADGQALSISIEARKLKNQEYDLFKGLFKTYPLMYIAADERDAILVRTNIRKDDVYMYPIKTTQEKARKLLVDMLEEMNRLTIEPVWYNTLFANCTSRIAYHVNRVTPERIPSRPWQSYVTGYADAFALQLGLLDIPYDLSIEEARKLYFITQKAQQLGDTEDFSTRIREGL
jgi:hypothetical protein